MALIFISSQTASSSASLAFTSGIDATYGAYVFYYVGMHPSADRPKWTFQVNTDGATGYNETMTVAAFTLSNGEISGDGDVGYRSGSEQNAETGYQDLVDIVCDDADNALSGYLTLYNPSGTTYAKHFIANTPSMYESSGGTRGVRYGFRGGYIDSNVSAALDEVSFKFDSGNIDAGTIYLYGVL
jgi:hypothetical protein